MFGKKKKEIKLLKCECGSDEFIEVNSYYYDAPIDIFYAWFEINGEKKLVVRAFKIFCRKCNKELKREHNKA